MVTPVGCCLGWLGHRSLWTVTLGRLGAEGGDASECGKERLVLPAAVAAWSIRIHFIHQKKLLAEMVSGNKDSGS